ncbi:hypothetical protein FOZ62_001856 [Perkinsus olseni]|uniref:Uncharacterized protein n=1 Tax=Perkinsus olseni TaxID=32597 RepID=A0A7J6R201_PEROL|nr:hypothetical protein FOZ62_001856 [Perkinsus olseni]
MAKAVSRRFAKDGLSRIAVWLLFVLSRHEFAAGWVRDIGISAAAASRLVRKFLLYWEKGRTSSVSECGKLLAVEAYGFSGGVVTEGRELIPLPPCRIEWYTSRYLELDTTFLATSSVEFMSGGVCEVTCLLVV